MDRKKDSRRVSVIVPAYNEADRIGPVLEILTSYKDFYEIIVVDDGSTDNTSNIIENYPVTYLSLKQNSGKGTAMDIGVQAAQGEIILFIDADISGLTHEVINQILEPMFTDDIDMFIAMRNRKIYFLRLIFFFTPLLGGERAVTRELWDMVPAYYKNRFQIEAGLNYYSQHYGKGFKYRVIRGLKQVIKEKKYGFWNGMWQRIGMFANIISAQFCLHFIHIPKSIKHIRILGMIAFQGLLWIGFCIGIIYVIFF